MKRLSFLIIILFFPVVSFSQQDSVAYRHAVRNRYGVAIIPSPAKNIYGIALGLVGSDVLCKSPYTKYTHGINLQIIGQGFFNVFYINKSEFSNTFLQNTHDSTWRRAVHNGVLLATFGTWTDKVNGLSVSLWMSSGSKINGVSFQLFWNLYYQVNGVSIAAYNHTAITNGVQIGIVNKTNQLRGFQFGLWNVNEKRSLPLVNWNFKY